MPAIYSLADIILSTSIEPEAFGRVSAEACSMTKPVIATNHGGSREIIENNVSGLLVNEIEDWYKSISNLIEDNKLREFLGRNARLKVEKYFSVEANKNTYLSIFNSIY